RRVVISEDRTHAGQSPLIESYDQFRRRFQTPSGMAFHLFEKPLSFGPKGESALQIVDKESGVVVGHLADMERIYDPTRQPVTTQATVSHVLPLSGMARLRGVSLLERDAGSSSWERSFAPLRASEEFPRVGPSGPTFCAFQAKQHLIVVDPSNGRVLWRRGNLEPQTGLFAENEWGLFGDHEVLTMFGQDFLSYTTYETATGRELRRGKLNVDLQKNRRVFGRKLFYLTDGNSGRRMRLWDPLTDQNEFDEPLSGQAHVTPDGELLLVQPNGRVRVIDVHAGLVKLDVNLPSEYVSSVSSLKAFADHDRYYLNLQRGVLDNSRPQFSYFLSDSLLLKTDVQGEVYAFARPTSPQPLDSATAPLGRRLWSRVLPQRSILRLDNARLPFLIALSSQQDRQHNNKTSLRVEALDAATGDLLGQLDRILPGRFLQSQLDIANSRLTLLGAHTHVTLDFGKDRQRVAQVDDPH
ncbi:MAG TPA: hypothetical protein VK137_02390, partial [Planctomycetaceae bacterium]|nr:hypothetical protein [Planctomycetaceae bacterium]